MEKVFIKYFKYRTIQIPLIYQETQILSLITQISVLFSNVKVISELFIMCARKNGLQCVDIFVVIRNIHYFLGVNMYHYNSLHRHTIVCMVSKRWYNQKSWHMSKKIKRPFAWLHLSLLWWDMPSIDIYQRSRFVWACKASWPCSFSVLSQANLY